MYSTHPGLILQMHEGPSLLRVTKFGNFLIIGETAVKKAWLHKVPRTARVHMYKHIDGTSKVQYGTTCTESGEEMGDGAKLGGLVNPSTEIMKTRPGLIEVALRGFAVVSQTCRIIFRQRRCTIL